jgi:plastocyanin
MRPLLRVVLLVPALGLPLGCGPTDAQPSAAPTTAAGHAMAEPKPKENAMPTAEGEAKEIVIDNFTFDPPELTVPVGTRVTWVNHDDVPHTATHSTKPRTFESGTLDTDQKYSFVFTKAGVYDYFCAVHPKMTGRITVK